MQMQNHIRSKFLILLSVILISANFLQPISRAAAQSIIVADVGPEFNRELQCLAENIYYESAKESYEGKLAVAQVTLNRVKSGKFPSSVCGVVKQKDFINGVMVCQFSWFCNEAYTKLVRNQYQWEESVIVARKALTSPEVHDTLYRSNALYYHADYVNPGWNKPKITKIGAHIFYR